MAQRRESITKRCPRCSINFKQCFCDLLIPYDNKNKVSIIFHLKEYYLPSNTGKITLESLKNTDYAIRGEVSKEETFLDLDTDHYQPLYLFPSENSVEINEELLSHFTKPIHLIVPDATWRQAKKFHKRIDFLKEIPHIHLKPDQKSQYTLRKQISEDGLCTIEAIAYAMKKIEGEELCQHLLHILAEMNRRVMDTRAGC